MEKHKLNFKVERPFGNLFRGRCVLIAAQDNEGNVLIGAKSSFYPPTISRLLGGGVNKGETYEQAAIRELEEELGVKIEMSDLTALALFDTTAIDNEGREYHNKTAVFKADIGKQSYQAGDDVKHIIRMTPDEVINLASVMSNCRKFYGTTAKKGCTRGLTTQDSMVHCIK